MPVKEHHEMLSYRPTFRHYKKTLVNGMMVKSDIGMRCDRDESTADLGAKMAMHPLFSFNI